MSTTIAEARQAIQEHFSTNWDDETLIAWDNVEFDSTTEFVRCSIQLVDEHQRSLGTYGARDYEMSMLCTVQVFTEINKGAERNDELCQKVREIFKMSMPLFRVVGFGMSTPNIEEGRFYHQNISTVFYSYATL